MAPSIKLPMVRWASSASCCLFTTPLALARCSRQRALSVSAARAQSTANSQVSSSSEASTSKQTQFTPNKLQHTSTSSATSNSSSRKQSGGPRLLRLPGKAHQLGRVSAVTYAEEIAVPSLIEALHQNRLVGCGKVTDARKPAGFQMFTNMRSRNERKVNIEGEALLLPHWFGGQCFLFENGGAAYWGVSQDGIEALEQTVLAQPGVKVSPLSNGSKSEELGFAYQHPSIKSTGDMLFLQQAFQQPAEDIAEENLTIALVPPPGGTTPSSTAIPALSQLERAEGLSMSRKALAERLAISAAMIRSTKIGVYETELENHLEAIEDIPKLLLEQQKVPGENTLIQHAGFLLSIRQRINLNDSNLLDAPEFLWEAGSEIEESFLQACAAQDLEKRLQILNTKLDYAEAQNAKLLELENTRTSHRLEWIIIILIAIEIGLAIMREGLPAWPSPNKKREPAHAI